MPRPVSRSWTVKAPRVYFSTERGARELGWTGMPIHDGFPGCTHGGHT